MSVLSEYLSSANYMAPFGRRRLYDLGKELSQRYLHATDLLIGVIGAEGAGKSTLIRGLFPGLELTNDDEGLNSKGAPLFSFSEDDFYASHTFHIDARFENAFHQKPEIAEAVSRAVANGRRVIVEHFDFIYKALGHNAQVLFSISDEVSVFRPTVFGPSPVEIASQATKKIKYRLMAHSAEDITIQILNREYGLKPDAHSNVRHGFVVGFKERPTFSITNLEKQVLEVIKRDVAINPLEGRFIEIDGEKIQCTGKRIHVPSSRRIENFRLMKRFKYDPLSQEHFIVGLVGKEYISGLSSLPSGGEWSLG